MVFDFKAFLGFCKRCELLLEKRLLLRGMGIVVNRSNCFSVKLLPLLKLTAIVFRRDGF